MAEKHEAPQFNPKHRIVGAIIVASLAVILVPLVLDERETPPELASVTEIPSPKPATPAGETKVVVTPVSELAPSAKGSLPTGPVEAAAPVSVAPETAKPPEKTEKIKPATTEASKPPVEKTAAAHSPTNEPDKKVGKGWVVQIGVFKERANAERLVERLQGQGFKVNSEPVNIDGARATRLRMGPFKDQATALKLQARLEKEADVKSAVFAYPQK